MATTTQRKILSTPMPANLYNEVERWAKKDAMTKAELVRDAVRDYIEDKKDWADIRRWGKETARKYNIRNEDDVERIVDEFRSGR